MAKDLRRLRPVVTRWFTLRHWRSQIAFLTGALVVGLAAVFVAWLADQAQALFRQITAISPYIPLALTPAGLMLSAYVWRRYFPGAQGSGIPQVIAASHMARKGPDVLDRLVSLRILAGKTVLLTLGLACGGAMGREGPTVQIGASLMRLTGRLGGWTGNPAPLLLAGGAAGVAAAFNTPLAGIVFAIEELGKSFEQRTSGTVILTVTLAGISSLALVGDYTYFGHFPGHTNGLNDLWAVLICGLGGGLLGGGFSRLLVWLLKRPEKFLRGIPARHPMAFAGACGLLLAVLGIASGGLAFGTGYEEARHLMTGAAQVPPGFGLIKALATLLSGASGVPGGLFAPSLAAGAGIGSDLHLLLPVVPLTTMALLGMVGYFSGVVQSPLTAFVIVLEMTAGHNMIIPLMATSLLAYSVSRLICPHPLYHMLALPFLKAAKEA